MLSLGILYPFCSIALLTMKLTTESIIKQLEISWEMMTTAESVESLEYWGSQFIRHEEALIKLYS